MIGIMTNDVALSGTSLKLKKGQKVILTPATNQPDPKGKYFARRPRNWENPEESEDSILITEEDVKVVSNH